VKYSISSGKLPITTRSLKMPVRHIPRYTTCSKNWIRLSCEAPINFTTEYETT